MKIEVTFKDGHREQSEQINALYASRYVNTLENVETYEIIDNRWTGEDYNG